MKTSWIALIIVVPFLAGCASDAGPKAAEVHEEKEGRTNTYKTYDYVLAGPAHFKWTVETTGEDTVSVWIFETSEKANFESEGMFEFPQDLARETFKSATREGDLPAGSWTVGITCNSQPMEDENGDIVAADCPFTLKVDITPL